MHQAKELIDVTMAIPNEPDNEAHKVILSAPVSNTKIPSELDVPLANKDHFSNGTQHEILPTCEEIKKYK